MIDVRVDSGAVRNAILKLPTELTREGRVAIQRATAGFHARFTRERLSGRSGSQGLDRRSGSLARRFVHKTEGSTIRDIVGRVGWLDDESARIAMMHQRGGTIRPRTKRALVIPLPGALTASGDLKAQYRGKSARDWPNATMIPRPGKTPIIVEKGRGKHAAWKLLAVLAPQVTLPPRLGFFQMFGDATERQRRQREFDAALKRGVKRGGF